VFSPRFWSF